MTKKTTRKAMTTEIRWNQIANEDILVVNDKSWLRTKRAKALKSHFDGMYNEWLTKWEKDALVGKAWWIYLVQTLRAVVFDTGILIHVDWIPENFSKLPFDKDEGRAIFEKFLQWFAGECAEDVYKMDEDTTETVQAGMHEVAKDWLN